MPYEVVIGLETHAELLTESKLWCRCSTRFGEPPNTQTCPVCLGMPGVLPVLNRRAFELAVQAALALRCRINQRTFFDRKGYYYPDLPKNYQISQNYCNLGMDGYLEIPADGGVKRIGIDNVHLEEDAGKNVHAERAGADYSLVDLNRAGVPLLEIVSAPDMRSVEQAEAYMHTLRQLLLYCRISDCKMEEGSLRFEASISLRRYCRTRSVGPRPSESVEGKEAEAGDSKARIADAGRHSPLALAAGRSQDGVLQQRLKPRGQQEYGARVEIKNLNSMKAVSKCLAYEARRQTRVLEGGGSVERETRLWDEVRECSERMRSKEEAQDYRYFPEPDLVPYVMDQEWLQRLRAGVPELPLERRERMARDYGLSEYDAQVLTDDRAAADYFERCLAAHDSPKSVANWMMNDINAILNERKIGIEDFEVPPERLAELIQLADDRTVTAQAARGILGQMIETGRDAATLVRETGAETIGEADDLAPVVEQALAESDKAVQDYLNGKKAAFGAIMGQVMRLTRGKADAKLVQELLRQKLDAMGGQG